MIVNNILKLFPKVAVPIYNVIRKWFFTIYLALFAIKKIKTFAYLKDNNCTLFKLYLDY